MNPHNMTHKRPGRDRYMAVVNDPDPATQPIEHTVEVTPADTLRGEIIGYENSFGPMSEAPLHYTLAWVYAALVRTGLYDQDWQTFVNRDLYAWGPADAFHDAEGGEGDPDPTPGSGPLEFG